jgi:hypothetical protein
MLKDMKGSPDGLRVLDYLKGKKYDIPEKLYHAFKGIGCCRDALLNEPEPAIETKMESVAPMNKAVMPGDNKNNKRKRRV